MFQICRIAERFDELKPHRSRPAVGLLRWHARLEVIRPIYEGPPWHAVQEAVRPLVLNEPVEHGPRAWQMLAHIRWIIAMHPEIVDHTHPHQRKRGDHLRQL